ncbi:Regulatory protein opaque-2 [Dichanthelium oligosanthes]|uniref:Regulatory protein opaque-2 n=1 Tax=Dichanthelium oligosanthes TaxID=888268 RepID=A0A1E5UK22_9POAL|nr:Regulatory protein opaque-2 [Dichanthelium oligosanthes]
MDHVVSMEEILDPFWDLAPPEEALVMSDGVIDGVVTHGDREAGNAIDQSPSEWSFERLLEEELLTDATPTENSSGSTLHPDPVVVVDHATMAPMAVSTVGDHVEYNTILKRKLEEDLATVAMWRASSVVHPERPQVSNNYTGGSRNPVQNKSNGEVPINRVQNAYIPARLATCSSSREVSPSDDDDMDGEVEILGFTMPTEEKVRKRKESNRESARRSRYRKAAYLKDIEDQVAQLRAENSSLLRRLAALNQKYTDATVDNRVLKADMGILRAKVKMAEDALNRIIGTSSQPSRPVRVPANTDASGSILDNIIDYLMNITDATTDNNFVPRMTAPAPLSQAERPASNGTSNNVMMNRIAAPHAVAIELLQNRMSAMPASSEATLPELSVPAGLDDSINMELGLDDSINMDMGLDGSINMDMI